MLVLTWTTGAALPAYINSNCSWGYPASAEGFPEQISGFAVTSASSENTVNPFIPSANQGLPFYQTSEKDVVHSMGESTLHSKVSKSAWFRPTLS